MIATTAATTLRACLATKLLISEKWIMPLKDANQSMATSKINPPSVLFVLLNVLVVRVGSIA